MKAPILLLALVLPAPGWAIEPLPRPDFSRMDPDVSTQLSAAWDLVEELEEAETQSRARAYATLGELCLLYRLTETAELAFANALELVPDVFEWVYYLGYARQELGLLDSAAEALARAVELRSDYLPGRYRLGQVEVALHQPDKAEEQFQAILAADPGFDAARYGLAQVHLLEGDHAAAVELLEQVVAAQPEASAAHYQLGLAYRGLGQLDRARESLGKLGRSKVTFPDPLADRLEEIGTGQGVPLTRAVAARNRKDYDTSIAAFRTVLDRDPQDITTRSGLAATLIEAGFEDAALAEFSEMLRLDPDHVYANFASGKILVERGRFEEALPLLERAVSVESDVGQTLGFLGFVQAQLDQLEEAEASFSRALELLPNDQQLLVQRARTRMRLGRLEESLADIETILAQDPTDAEALEARPRLLGRLGRFAEAAEAFQQLLVTNPRDSAARFGRGLALLLARDYAAAVRHLDESVNLMPDDVALNHLLARTLATLPDAELRDGARALDLAQRLLQADSTAEHAETLAMALAENGQYEQAAGLQQQVLDRATQTGQGGLDELRRRLELYRARQPCREPWLGGG